MFFQNIFICLQGLCVFDQQSINFDCQFNSASCQSLVKNSIPFASSKLGRDFPWQRMHRTETRTVQCALGWHRIATTFIQAVHKVQHWSTPIQQRIATVLIEAACERCPPLRTLEFQRLQRCVRDVDNEETYDSYYERGMSTTETGWPLKNLRIKNFNSRLNQIPDMLTIKKKVMWMMKTR